MCIAATGNLKRKGEKCKLKVPNSWGAFVGVNKSLESDRFRYFKTQKRNRENTVDLCCPKTNVTVSDSSREHGGDSFTI
jgi:hypothetical protein